MDLVPFEQFLTLEYEGDSSEKIEQVVVLLLMSVDSHPECLLPRL